MRSGERDWAGRHAAAAIKGLFVLYEVLFVLALCVERWTLLFGLVTTTEREPAADKSCTERGHGELLYQENRWLA